MKNIENIFLVRHAESLRNICLGGDIPDRDVPLSDNGRTQAGLLGDAMQGILPLAGVRPGTVRLWASPYRRTRETRDLMLGKISDYVIDSREDESLTEWNFGLFDGLTEEERFQKYPDAAKKYAADVAMNGKFRARPPQGESWHDVICRIREFIGSLCAAEESESFANPGRNLLIVSHGVAMRAFVMALMNYGNEWLGAEPNPNNASVIQICRPSQDSQWRQGRYEYIFDGFSR